MAYDGFRSPPPPPGPQQQQQHPYEQPVFSNSSDPYSNQPPPPHHQQQQQQPQNNLFQPPYPEHYDLEPDLSRVPSQPQQQQPYLAPAPGSAPAPHPPPPPIQQPQPQSACPPPQPSYPPPNSGPEPFYDPSRFYQAHSSSINQAAAAAFQSAAVPGAGAPPPPPPPLPGSDGSSAYISPEILSQITASVVQQLRGTNLGASPTQPQPQQPQQFFPQNSDVPPFPPSASTQSDYSSSFANPQTYTPPSPNMSSDGHMFSSPSLGAQPQYETGNQDARRPSPEQERYPHSPRGAVERPDMPRRRSTVRDETTMEKIWGQFFDSDGKPTSRLGQFLRGIAVHLIEDYPPGDTIVVRPEKMQKYYENTKVQEDQYPWFDIFDDRTSSISRLYRDVQAEHHLVQDHVDDKPDIPGLTPRGFERWMTLMIQAHPDQEFERLQRTVLDMPINNPDDKNERFPKELSRRLFPKSSDKTVKGLLEEGIVTHCKIKPSVLAATTKSSRSRSRHHRGSSAADASALASPAQSPSGFDQSTHSASGEDEVEEPATSRPIERERKPYSAHPGGGRPYNDSPVPKAASPVDIPQVNLRDDGNREEWTGGPAEPTGRYKRSADDRMGRSPDDRVPYGSPTPPGGFSDDPLEPRYRSHDREPRRKEDRRHDNHREHRRDRDKRRHHERPSRVSWANDEDYYRGTGSLGGRGGDSYGHDPMWTGRY